MNTIPLPPNRHDVSEGINLPGRILVALACGFLMALCIALLAQPGQARATHPLNQTDSTYTHTAYLPLAVRSPVWLNISTRQAAQSYYTNLYLTSDGADIGWTGNLDSCTPGTTSAAFRATVVQRINYYRGMAGVPNAITLNDDYNLNAQAAALMMSRNSTLDHTPPNNWSCYSASGYTGASHSNLALGVYGPAAITLYMRDSGSSNAAAGHRRWILYPQTRQMGSGDLPPTTGHMPANALYILDSHTWEARPATREPYVAWPPPGYVPCPVVYARWSFAYAGADFSLAKVRMTSNGSSVNVSVPNVTNGYGENAIVWIPLGLNDGSLWPKPAADTLYHVTISNVTISGVSRSFDYDVTIFDPAT
jgi:uncharacterized protein YkwD